MKTIQALCLLFVLTCVSVLSAQDQTIDQVTEKIKKINDENITPLSESAESSMYSAAVKSEIINPMLNKSGNDLSGFRELAYKLYSRATNEKSKVLQGILFKNAWEFSSRGKDDIMSKLSASKGGVVFATGTPSVDLKSLGTKAEAKLLVEWCLKMDGVFAAEKQYDISQRYLAYAEEAVVFVKEPDELKAQINARKKAIEEHVKVAPQATANASSTQGANIELELKGVAEIPREPDQPPVPTGQVFVKILIDGKWKSKLYLLCKGDKIGDGDLKTNFVVTSISKTIRQGGSTQEWELKYKDDAGKEYLLYPISRIVTPAPPSR